MDNVEWLKPEMNFKQVIEKYGYPFIGKEVCDYVSSSRKFLQKNPEYKYEKERGKADFSDAPARFKILCGTYPHKENGKVTEEASKMYDRSKYKFMLDANFEISSMCCNIMKKKPVHKYTKLTGKKPMTGEMASESRLRTQKWLQNGCNAFNLTFPKSTPMAFWTEQDVLLYIKENNLKICSIYGDIVSENGNDKQMNLSDFGIFDIERPLLKTTGCERTGCMFCGYGCHLQKEGEGRFETMKNTHLKQYEWVMKPWEEGGLNYKEIIDWLNEHGNLNIRY